MICHPFYKGVPEAYVPVIGAKISGIPIDLTMARLTLSSIPDDLTLDDDNLLRNLDERCVRSLNGTCDHAIYPTRALLRAFRFTSDGRNFTVGSQSGRLP